MAEISVAFMGDVVGSPGRRALSHALPTLRGAHNASLVIVNGENARHGSGLSADNYRELRRLAPGGVDAITLGDHCFRERAIIPLLADPAEPVARPANLSASAPGKRLIRLQLPSGGPPVYVITVLGRLFMPLHGDSPFTCIDRELAALPERDALVIVEMHAEATSEKIAMAWHCLSRWTAPGSPAVVAVLGTHTHVQTSDARVLDRRLAAMTDLGMTGPHRSVIGRSISAVLESMVNQGPATLDVASDEPRAQGCVLKIDLDGRRAAAITAIDIPAPD